MKRIDNKKITPQQLKALHAGFNKMGFSDDDRHDYISHLTNGRTTSSKELTIEEAKTILSSMYDEARIADREKARKIVGIIYKLSFKISFLNQGYEDCRTEEDFQMNKAKINAFCRNKTRFRKNLTEMSLAELESVRLQFESIAHKEEKS